MLAMMLVAVIGTAAGATKIYISDFSISPGETKTIAVNLDTDETTIGEIRGTFVLPEGLEAIENTLEPNSVRAAGALKAINPVSGLFWIRLFTGSFVGTSGELFTFKVKASSDLAASSKITYKDVTYGPQGNMVDITMSPTTVTNAAGGSGGGGGEDPTPTPAGTVKASFVNPAALTIMPQATTEQEVEVQLDNSGVSLTGLQARLTASDGIEITSVEKTDRLSGWNYNNGRILSVGAISGTSGAVFKVKLKAAEGFAGDATLQVTGIVGTDASSKRYPSDDLSIDIHVVASPVVSYSVAGPLTLAPGKTASFSVQLNSELQMALYQAKLVLPAGISAVVEKGDLSATAPNFNASTGALIGTGLTGKVGTLMNITLTATDDFVANGKVELTNMVGSTTASYRLPVESIALDVQAVATLKSAPTAKTLTYNGAAQALVAAGSASGSGSLVYSLDNTNFTADIPTAKDAGDYTVYYKVVAGADQVLGTEATYVPVSVSIAKAALSAATLSVAELVYNNQVQTAEVAEVKAGEIVVPAADYTVSDNTGKDKGIYTVTVKANDASNFTGTVTVNFAIVANKVNDEAYAALKAELDALDQTIADAIEAIEENASDVKDDYLALLADEQAKVDDARTALKAANENVQLTTESTNENVPSIDDIVDIVVAAEQAQAEKEAADKLAADKAAFEEYKNDQKDAADALAEDGDSDASKTLVTDAKAAIEALAYDEAKSLDENKAAADAIVSKLASDLEAQRDLEAAEQLAADKAAFEKYKNDQKDAADALAEDGDSHVCEQLIEDAKAAIDALAYDVAKNLDENKAVVDAIVSKLDADLVAQREAEISGKYQLTYYLEGELWLIQYLKEGEVIGLPEIPEKVGYSFGGWGSVPTTMPDHSLTYYGEYTINQYTVKFVFAGEVISEKKQEYQSAIVAPENPTKEGYTFGGWGEMPQTVPANDITIEAQYTVNSYKVTYMVGDAEYMTFNMKYGDKIPAVDDPEQEGYTFMGWSEIPATMPAADVTITATFEANVYVIRYYIGEEVYAEEEVTFGTAVVLREYEVEDPERYTYEWMGEKFETMPAHDLQYTLSITDGIKSIVNAAYVNVYTLDGKLIKGNVKFDDVKKTLPRGTYIICGKKVSIK